MCVCMCVRVCLCVCACVCVLDGPGCHRDGWVGGQIRSPVADVNVVGLRHCLGCVGVNVTALSRLLMQSG